MLSELHIENLGVIEKLDLSIGEGLVALTGETGAGKTMLVEAIDLLVGGRADASVVRTGCEEARVEGRFVTDESEVILCRVVPVTGRSRAYVNGRLATVAQLAEYGAEMVDLHGQHAHQSLLGASAQRLALDHFCGVDLEPLRNARARLTEIEALLATLGGDERARAREIDLLRFQVKEIADANLQSPSEDEDLSRSEDLLADAVAHREALYAAAAALQDDDGASDVVGRSIAAISHRETFVALVERLKNVQAEIDDVAREMRDVAETIEEDPAKLDDVRQRRHLLVDLRRKYGESLSDVIAYGAESGLRLDELESFEARAATLDSERAAAVQQLRSAEKVVGDARRAAAPKLAKAAPAPPARPQSGKAHKPESVDPRSSRHGAAPAHEAQGYPAAPRDTAPHPAPSAPRRKSPAIETAPAPYRCAAAAGFPSPRQARQLRRQKSARRQRTASAIFQPAIARAQLSPPYKRRACRTTHARNSQSASRRTRA